MEIYDRVKKLADNENKSVAQVEREAGLTKSTLNNWKNGSTPSADSLYDLADYFKVDPRYIYKGEVKSYDMTSEHKELLNNYEKFPLETQVHIRGAFQTLKEHMEQVTQKNEQEKIQLEQRVQKEVKKTIILEMLANKADENFIRKVTNIPLEEFEIIRKEFEKKHKKKSKS